jgi:acyl carrier protein
MERELDAMLARDYVVGDTLLAPFEEQPAIHGEVKEAVVALSTSAASAQEEVELWMLDWLSKQRRIRIDEMDARTTFVDIGLDSVSAVELSFALQTWLDFEVDSTVVWQYPSIGVLSRFLAQEKDARAPAAPEAAVSYQVSITDDLSALSDDDLEKALAVEMD